MEAEEPGSEVSEESSEEDATREGRLPEDSGEEKAEAEGDGDKLAEVEVIHADIELLTPGEKFGDYQVLSCLSLGILGGIYRMQHITKFHEVCVAVFPLVVSEIEGFKDRFAGEVEILTKLEHPNIAKVVGSQEISGYHCLLIEPLEGENLHAYMAGIIEEKLKAAGALDTSSESGVGRIREYFYDQAFGLPPGEVQDVLKQTILGLDAAHSAGVYHNDLDPQKLIRGSDGKIKILGLGFFDMIGPAHFARLLSAEIPPINLGRQKFVVTPKDFVSPELIEGNEPDLHSEIYSLGSSIYYLLTGSKHTIDKIPPSEYSAAIQTGWDNIVGHCLEDESSERYSALHFLETDIDRVDKIVKPQAGEGASIAKQIERIPIPKKIEQKLDPAKLKLLRLAILGLFAIGSVGLASYFYTIIFTEGEKAEGPIVRRVDPGQEPMVSMTIIPAQSKVSFFGGGESTFIVGEGKLKVVMPRGDYEVTVGAKDHEQRRLSLKVGPDTLQIPVSLKPAWALLEVTTVPGSRVMVARSGESDIDLGIVPESGLLRAEETLYSGTYELKILRQGYESASLPGVILPSNQLVSREVDLRPIPGRMTILTRPEGAAVYMNGQVVGNTPLLLEDLPIGVYLEIKASLVNYREAERSIRLPAGFDDLLDFGELTRMSGAIDTVVTMEARIPDAVEQANIVTRIEGQTFSGVIGFIPNVRAGMQELVVEHPNYEIWRRKIRVADGHKTSIEVDLQPRPGQLFIKLERVLPFKLIANGAVVSSENGRFLLPAGRDHKLELQVRDHLTARRVMRFSPNEKEEWAVPLVRFPGPELDNKWSIPYVGSDMVWIPAGEVLIGSPPPEQARLPEEGPQSLVAITQGYWIGKFEVTQKEYRAVMGENPSEFAGSNRPVERLSWNEAMEFCRKINDQERKASRLPNGYEYRLPTQAEWELACRSGTATPFHFGERADSSLGNFKGVYPRGSVGAPVGPSEIYGTSEVGNYKPNALGLFDMHGNVRELCYDYFNSRFPGVQVADWWEERKSVDRVYRGGGWEDYAHQVRSASRQRIRQVTVSNSIGFRVALAPKIKD